MSDTTLDAFVELKPLLATFRPDLAADHRSWEAAIDGVLAGWDAGRVQAAVAEIDGLLAVGLSEHDLGKALWSLGAEAFPDRTPVATLHDLRGRLTARL